MKGKQTWPQAVLLLLLFAGTHPAFSQTEIHVKLKTSSLETRSFFEDFEKDENTKFPASLKGILPNTIHLKNIQSLIQGSSDDKEELSHIYTLNFEEDVEIEGLARNLMATGKFEYVEENRQVRIHSVQVDPPNDDSISGQWYHRFIGTFESWETTKGDASIKIGVVDTGLDYDHPEFEGQVFINPLEDVNGNGSFEPWPSNEQRNGVFGDFDGVDNDQNGFVDDVSGYDFVDQPRSPFGGDYLFEDANPNDDNGHGTVVTGVIGAKENNQFGGAGVAPGCKIVTLRALSANGNGDNDDIARAIVYGADNGIQILNFSFGDIFASRVLHEAIKYAYSKGVIMVSSAGNGSGDDLHYPSGFNEVLSISASTLSNNDFESLWPLSSFGPTVDLSAPGANILTTVVLDTLNDGRIEAFSRTQGTSLSAPMVSGALGLLLSKKGNLTPQQARGILTSTARDISLEGWDHFTGAGRLDMVKALDYVGASSVQIISPINDGGSAAARVPIIGTVLDPEFLRYHIEYMEGVEDANEWVPIVSDQVYQQKADTLTWWDMSALEDGEYTLRIRIDKTNGSTAEDRIRFIKDMSPPEIDISVAHTAWDNEERKMLFIFRDSDQADHWLVFRRIGTSNFQELASDRTTRNGHFLLGRNDLSDGEYEYKIRSVNAAGLVAETALDTFVFQNKTIPRDGFEVLPYTLPMGRYLPRSYDMDGDGLKEVVMSRYNRSLSFGKLLIYEFNGGGFVAMDSISQKPILIPKDIADTDGDDLLELLTSVNDSIFIFEQSVPSDFPKTQIFSEEGQGRFAARFGDVDGDGAQEMLVKDFKDYFVYEGGGNAFAESAILEDLSPGYEGSIAPKALIGDFDEDGKQEIVYGDFDGDFLVYESLGGNAYANTFVDSTDYEKGGSYILNGDFDGDGQEEIFIALHKSFLKNSDKEYDLFHWWLRIFKATDDDQFEQVWEDYLFDHDGENFNASIAGNIDNDPQDEIVFTTFPRTYVLEYQNGNYEMTWFRYGDLSTHLLIGDFNLNGINEFLVGRADTAFFYEKSLSFAGPRAVNSLRGAVLGETSIALDWQASTNTESYEVWRVKDPLNSTQAEVVPAFTGTSFVDQGLETGELYLYTLRSNNPNLNPSQSGFGNFVFLQPHARPEIDSLQAVSARQLELYFSWPIDPEPNDLQRFTLNGQYHPNNLIRAGAQDRRLLLSFAQSFVEGNNQLDIDTTFQDAGRAYVDRNSTRHDFVYQNSNEDALILTRWEATENNEAILYFNYPLDENSALDTANFSVSPFGWPTKVEWVGEDNDAVKVSIEKARIGALGYAVSVSVENVCAIVDVCIDKEGSTATFSSHKDDLSEVFVYPNPILKHSSFDGLRFANLTEQATIKVYTVSGLYVGTIEENDGDGGVEWDMRNLQNERIKPGIYLYHVSTDQEGVEDFLGKFSVVE